MLSAFPLYTITLILIIACVFSMWRDNRSLLNPLLFMAALFFGYLSVTALASEAGFELTYYMLFAAAFLGVPLLVFLSGIFLVYNGVVLLRREGFSKANLLSGALGVVILAFYGLLYVRFTSGASMFVNSPVVNSLFILAASSYLIFGFAFGGFMLYSILYAFIPKRKEYDFIIIHGAGLLGGERVTPLLQRRIEKAVQAWRPGMRIIASGGQGVDEKVSEARAIANFLFEHTDIPHDAILLEERSTTTRENLLYSKELGEKLVENPRFLFVTNGYHVFRTSVYARSVGMKGDGLGCTTARYYIPSAFIREFVAVCVRWKWLFIVYYAIIIFGLLISYV